MTNERTKPYGFVLVLRGVARAAINLGERPASLRVLCVLADYMNQDGSCRFGQGTVAARLGMSRQAVNKHLRILADADILTPIGPDGIPSPRAATKGGRTLEYWLNMEGLAEERAGEAAIKARRTEKLIKREGLVTFREREGITAYDATITKDDMLTGNSGPAKTAMAAAEAALGIRYEVAIPASEDTGFTAYFRRVSIEPVEPAIVAIKGAIARAIQPEAVDFG
jgi:DNA-binding transcriptional ArsR family regulator